jgi:ClpX C4-type zinc finger
MNEHTASDRDVHAPPPAIGSGRVIAYAVVDRDVRFTGKQRLFVDGKLLGRVPRIAICRDLQKDLKDYLILFCDRKWQVLGIAGAKSLSLAKKQVERYYLGISGKWMTVNTSVKAAKRWLIEKYPKDVCSFCGQIPYTVEAMFLSPSAVICSSCVGAFANELKRRVQG